MWDITILLSFQIRLDFMPQLPESVGKLGFEEFPNTKSRLDSFLEIIGPIAKYEKLKPFHLIF